MERGKMTTVPSEILKGWQGRPLTFMEVCGSHTMAIARFGIRNLLPKTIRLISGPGCPVCVTPVAYVDHALALAEMDGMVVTTFGDMMRVPGTPTSIAPNRTLTMARAEGADVRVVYSPLDALTIAEAEPDRQVVFLGVGFETTAPGLAATIRQAGSRHIANFSMLSAAKTIPKALSCLAGAGDIALDGLLCPGHVTAILGIDPYREMTERHGLACAVAGFEPGEILRGLASMVDQVTKGELFVDNCYPGVVKPEGNPKARELMYQVFEPIDAVWRGLGTIEGSGLGIRESLADFDAARRFDVSLPPSEEPRGCRCGDVLKGSIDPEACALFGKGCTPEQPKGACMVSGEGSCRAAYHYRMEAPPA
jgi:hydrogenase expression/formation protein HypD